jgi:acyl dehydratase
VTTTVYTLEEILALKGSDLGAGDWMEITQDRVNIFADATDDHQWIHVDPERAAQGPFGGPIVHGYLTLSLLAPLFTELLVIEGGSMTINYGLNRVRFPSAVPVGARIRLRGTVAEVVEVAGGAELTVDLTVEVEGRDRPGCVAQAIYRHLR